MRLCADRAGVQPRVNSHRCGLRLRRHGTIFGTGVCVLGSGVDRQCNSTRDRAKALAFVESSRFGAVRIGEC
jgi:hypothetical protein